MTCVYRKISAELFFGIGAYQKIFSEFNFAIGFYQKKFVEVNFAIFVKKFTKIKSAKIYFKTLSVPQISFLKVSRRLVDIPPKLFAHINFRPAPYVNLIC